MNELRWILLTAGVFLIAGIYLWGLRARRRAAAPELDRVTRVEPARTVPVVAEPSRADPQARFQEPAYEEPAFAEPQSAGMDALDGEPAPRRALGSTVRREPRLDPRFDARFEPAVTTTRVEPRFEPEAAEVTEHRHEAPTTAAEPPRKAPQQQIIAVRVVASPGAQFEGAQLLAALHADGFTFGRYQIFHRLDDTGRPVVSLASLKEPGTFDPDSMPGAGFRGVALFAVMPGPLPALQAFDELIVTARALASTLGGQLQDERGIPLSLQRIGQLREEVIEFERARAAASGG
jgi:cell division protein ZipA